jgi:hypothetical protein
VGRRTVEPQTTNPPFALPLLPRVGPSRFAVYLASRAETQAPGLRHGFGLAGNPRLSYGHSEFVFASAADPIPVTGASASCTPLLCCCAPATACVQAARLFARTPGLAQVRLRQHACARWRVGTLTTSESTRASPNSTGDTGRSLGRILALTWTACRACVQLHPDSKPARAQKKLDQGWGRAPRVDVGLPRYLLKYYTYLCLGLGWMRVM